MDVLTLVVWMNSKASWAELDAVVSACEYITRARKGRLMTHRERMQALQCRVAEEFRALHLRELAEAMTAWALDGRVTDWLMEEFIESDLPSGFYMAIPDVLEYMSLELQRTYCDFASGRLFED